MRHQNTCKGTRAFSGLRDSCTCTIYVNRMCRGGGGNLGVILVRICEPVFWNLPQSYILGLRKNDLFIYLIEQNVYIFIYMYCYTLFAVCKQSLQINIKILISELSIWPKTWVFSNRDVRKRDHSCINDEKLGQSYTFPLKKGAYRISGSAEKGGYSGGTSVV